jgi:methionyl-tRNA synthetase
MRNNFNRHIITAALPYANGPVHIGHLAGVYIPSDIYSRFLRSQGKEVLFISGSDEHGVPITIRAKSEEISPQQVVDKYHKIIGDSFKDFGISFDIYSRTSSKTHKETASEFFTNLHDNGILKELRSEQFYDVKAQQFLADRYIQGTCPKCKFENAYGDQCEKCGSTLSSNELINPHSMLSGEKPILKQTSHWYLPLDKYESWLKEFILEEHKEWKNNVYGSCKSWINGGLLPRAITRDLDWGVPLPLEGSNGKVLYVWFDAPIGYISATKELAKEKGFNWKTWWQSDDTELIHFIGKDNIVFHCIIFPVMLYAHKDYILPNNIPANEFLNLEGNKISTSRNWAVWLHEYLIEFPDKQDVLRYVLAANMPETKDNDFTWKDFQQRNNSELVGILGNFIHRTLVLTNKYFNGIVPKCENITDYDIEILNNIDLLKDNIKNNINVFKFKESLSNVIEYARIGNKYLAETEPWKIKDLNSKELKNIINISLQICLKLTIVLEPFLPFTAEKLRLMLNINKYNWIDLENNVQLLESHKINESVILFKKIEDNEIEYQIKKLENIKINNEKNN